jgi:hypothetical protein
MRPSIVASIRVYLSQCCRRHGRMILAQVGEPELEPMSEG